MNQELKRGNVKKEKCEYCEATENLEFHHEDYNNPKKYKVLCRQCHLKEHNKLKPKMESIFD